MSKIEVSREDIKELEIKNQIVRKGTKEYVSEQERIREDLRK